MHVVDDDSPERKSDLLRANVGKGCRATRQARGCKCTYMSLSFIKYMCCHVADDGSSKGGDSPQQRRRAGKRRRTTKQARGEIYLTWCMCFHVHVYIADSSTKRGRAGAQNRGDKATKQAYGGKYVSFMTN